MSTARLTLFSYAVLVLIGEGGAGPHDLARMMRQGSGYWTAAKSQWYAEPKRLAELGYLAAEKQPGRTRERTQYTLTDQGRQAIRAWVAAPASLPRIQDEPIVRALAADLVGPDAVAAGLRALREQIAERQAQLDRAENIAQTLPHRERILMINHRHARRQLESQIEWLEDILSELESRGR